MRYFNSIYNVFLLFVALILVPRAVPAQGLGIFQSNDKVAEYGSGAALNLLSRGPWVAKDWRHPVLRFVGVQATSLAYEKLLDWNGFSWHDVRERTYGYLIAEGVIEGARALYRALK